MRRIIPTSLVLLALSAPASALAQSNSGVGAYGESPPSAGGNGDTSTTTTAPPATVPQASSTAPTTSAGTTTTTSPTTAATQSSASSVSGKAGGELPMTGSNTLVLALIAVALLGAGLALRRGLRLAGPRTEFGTQAYLSALKRVSRWEDRPRT